MNKKDVVHIYNGILLSPIKKIMSLAAIRINLDNILSEAKSERYHMISLRLHVEF